MSERGDPQRNFEQIVSMARGPKGDKGEPGEEGKRGLSWLQGRAVVFLFALAALSGAGNLFWTAHEVNSAAAAQRHVQAVAAAAQAKAAIPVCVALLNLSKVQGSHGDTGATYGANLQVAFRRVYDSTQCPRIMRQKP